MRINSLSQVWSWKRKTFSVDHDATIVEADGTEVRIAPLDVQYQNATVWGKLITNFAGPMNNFILGGGRLLDFDFHAGSSSEIQSNNFSIIPDSAIALKSVLKIQPKSLKSVTRNQ